MKTFRAFLLYFLPKASVFFVQNQPITPRASTFARIGKNLGSDGGALTTPRQVHGEDVAAAVDSNVQ